MLPSDFGGEYRFTPDAVTPETASQTVRREPVLPTTAAAAMPELSVAIVAIDSKCCTELRRLVDATGLARTVLTCASFPAATDDPVTKSLKTINPEVLLIDIPSDNFAAALRAIELLHQEMPESAVFAVGSLNPPEMIVNAMRAGAREFIERPTTTTDLHDAFIRLRQGVVRRTRPRRSPQREVSQRIQGPIPDPIPNPMADLRQTEASALQRADGKDIGNRCPSQREEEVREVAVSLEQKPEVERIPCINDVVLVQGRRGELFRVDAVYVSVKLVGLVPIHGHAETDPRKEDLAPWSTLMLLHPGGRYDLRNFVPLARYILPIVMLVALLWVLIHFGALPFLFVGFALFVAWGWTVRFARQKRIRKRLHRGGVSMTQTAPQWISDFLSVFSERRSGSIFRFYCSCGALIEANKKNVTCWHCLSAIEVRCAAMPRSPNYLVRTANHHRWEQPRIP